GDHIVTLRKRYTCQQSHGGGRADTNDRHATERVLHRMISRSGTAGEAAIHVQTSQNVAIFRSPGTGRTALTSPVPPLICPSTWRPEAILERFLWLQKARAGTVCGLLPAQRPVVHSER